MATSYVCVVHYGVFSVAVSLVLTKSCGRIPLIYVECLDRVLGHHFFVSMARGLDTE